jgi:hypothetical protein
MKLEPDLIASSFGKLKDKTEEEKKEIPKEVNVLINNRELRVLYSQ